MGPIQERKNNVQKHSQYLTENTECTKKLPSDIYVEMCIFC